MTSKEKSKKAPMLEVCKIMLKLPVTFFSPTLISSARRGNTAELQAKTNTIQNKATVERCIQDSYGIQ